MNLSTGFENCRNILESSGSAGATTKQMFQNHKRHHILTQNFKSLDLWILTLVT